MNYLRLVALLLLLFFVACGKDEPDPEPTKARNFQMGFTTWSYGPQLEDVNTTYAFIDANADIYAEHIDNNIPWSAWINDEALPIAFTNEILGRANRRIVDKELLLSVSVLNSNRNELAFDLDGTLPSFTSFDDEHIRNAYFEHINYLVQAFTPDYLVIAIEVNELRLNAPEKWEGYTQMIEDVRGRIKALYPALKIAESISLHNFFQADVPDPDQYVQDITEHMNQNDFVGISYYPFLKGQSTLEAFQQSLDFLHAQASKPIAIVETAHIAEDLVVPNFELSINGNVDEQHLYLQTLMENAVVQDYKFMIWWAHRDFDALWETFPDEVKDLGQLWRDTGLLDEDGNERPAFALWKHVLDQ